MRKTILLLLGILPVFTAQAKQDEVSAQVSAQAKQEEISVPCDWGTLHGTLVTPDGGSDVVALIIAGSGPTDRNGNSTLGLAPDAYRMLAGALEKEGIASLRFDKRGIGASRFSDPGFRHETVRFEDFIADVEVLVAHLKEAGFKRIALVGHSEGALIALVAASETPAVDTVVSLSGAAFPVDDILLVQLDKQLTNYKPEMMAQVRSILARMKQGETVPGSDIPQEVQALFHPSVQPFLISQMRYDPREVIGRVRQPVAIIGGDNDLQITPDNARALAEAQPEARLHIIEGMTHVLKISPETDMQRQMLSVYLNGALPISEELVETTAGFIRNIK
jgi:pimeloyl-ACP methyl ester carboxylesterase